MTIVAGKLKASSYEKVKRMLEKWKLNSSIHSSKQYLADAYILNKDQCVGLGNRFIDAINKAVKLNN